MSSSGGHEAPGGAFGPWRASAPLGAGSASLVYLAEHEDSGRRVALKVLRDVRAMQLGALRREIRALSELDHPGVVRVLDAGQTQGVPWYAMEYHPHPTLAEHFERHGGAGRWRERAATIAGLARTIAHLHERGVVHGDLKPDNVIVTPDGPVLVDFGLATRFRHGDERAYLDPEAVLGTPVYMAPECFSGHGADPRSDLYSLGCLLYEALTGAPPFAGPPRTIFRAKSDDAAPDPRLVDGSVPDGPSLLVRQLTEPDPDRRRTTAATVAEELTAGLQGRAPAAARSFAHRPVLKGRERERAALDAHLRGDDERILEVRGPSGIGKTFLVAEWSRSVPARHLRLVHSCRPEDAERAERRYEPLRGVVERIVDHCIEFGTAYADALLDEESWPLTLLDPRLATLGEGRFERPRIIAQEQGLDRRMQDALLALLARWCARRPVLFVIDDAQWLDAPTRRLLGRLEAEGPPVETLRVVLIRKTDASSAAVEGLAHRVLEVEPLGRRDLADLVEDLVGGTDRPDDFDSILDAAHGNPLYVAEFARIVSHGVDSTTVSDWPLPPNVQDIVRQRFERLPPVARTIVGEVLALERMATEPRILALHDAADTAALDALIDAELIVPDPSGRLGLHHDHHARVFREHWARDARRSAHAAAARLLDAERRAPAATPSLELLGTLARCLEAIERDDDAFAVRTEAAALAAANADFRTAAAHLARALERPVARLDGTRRAALATDLAEARSAIGETRDATAGALDVLDALGYRLPRSTEGWNRYLARRLLARPFSGLRRRHRHAPPELQIAIRALDLLAMEYFMNDNFAGAFSMSLLQLDLDDANADAAIPPRAYSVVGHVSATVGLSRTGARLGERGRRAAALTQRPAKVADYWNTESVLSANRGLWRDALDAVERGLDCFDELFDPWRRDLMLVQRGHVEYFTGRERESIDTYAEVEARAIREGNVQFQSWCDFSIARAQLPLGETEAAADRLERAVDRMDADTEVQARAITLGLLAEARLRLGRADALDVADRAAELLALGRSAGFPTIEAFSGVLAVWTTLASRRRQARRLLKRFRTFTGTTPAAAPRCLYWTARLDGSRQARARRTLQRGMDLAEDYGMAGESRRCRDELDALRAETHPA